MAAIRAGILTPMTKAELERAKAECAEFRAAVEAERQLDDRLTAILPRAADRYREMVDGLEHVLLSDAVSLRPWSAMYDWRQATMAIWKPR